MPKRKSVDSYERIKRKIRKLERKLRRKRRSDTRYVSESSELDYSFRASPKRRQGSEQSNVDIAMWTDDEEDTQNEPGPSGPSINMQSVITNPAAPTPAPAAPCACPPATSPAPPGDTQPPTGSPLLAEPEPSTSACPPSAPAEIDEELFDILGTDPTADKKYGNEVNKDLSVRLQHWVTNGLSKEIRSQLKEKYLTPENCKLIDPPALNAEIRAAVSDVVIKRDKAIENKQKQLTLAMTSLSEAISLLFSSKDRDTNLLKLLMDAARILADCQHTDTITRRNFLLNSVKSEIKNHIQNTKVDGFLFGENLHEVLKSAKAINKTGTEMKLQPQKPANKKSNPNSFNPRNLNSKNPGPTRRQTGPPRTKEPATSSTRNRHASSSRTSQRHQQRDRQSYRR